VVVPGFQLFKSGQIIPVVADINRKLDAAIDPWGCADWWLRFHPGTLQLGIVPADLAATHHLRQLQGMAIQLNRR
jgi:hypothetical protein